MGVYGIGYAIAAGNPLRHWPIVLVGLLGKLFGPLGFLFYAIRGELPWIAGWTIVTKDHSLSAQWEHTILVTGDGYEVLTLSAGSPPPPAFIKA